MKTEIWLSHGETGVVIERLPISKGGFARAVTLSLRLGVRVDVDRVVSVIDPEGCADTQRTITPRGYVEQGRIHAL